MLKETDIEKVREVAIALLYTDPHPSDIPFFVYHPVFSSTPTFITKSDRLYDLVNSHQDFIDLCKIYEQRFRESDLLGIYMLIRDAYQMTFLKYAKPYLSLEDFSHYFGHTWVSAENPNQDVNCKIPYMIQSFKECDKKLLMTEEDYKVFINLPEEMTVYRGVAIGRNPKGLSWTSSLEKAKWFADRFNSATEKGYVQYATIKKKNVLAYFNTRNEDELVCNITISAIKRLEEEPDYANDNTTSKQEDKHKS